MSWNALRVAVGVAMGGSVGWIAHEEVNQRKVNDNKTSWTAANINEVRSHLMSWSNQTQMTPWDDNWDRRDPKSLVRSSRSSGVKAGDLNNNNDNDEETKRLTPTATRHLFLIRHGQYDLSAQTDEFRKLTALGQEQATYTGQRLQELGYPYRLVVSSTLTRAKETTDLILQHMPNIATTQCNMLCEGAPFPPEPPLSTWKLDYKFYQDGARIEAAFCKYFHRADPKQQNDSYEIIVCHANVIRYFVCRALQLPPEAWLRMSLNHGSITSITIRPSGRVTLRGLGDTGHMPPDRVTTS